MKPVIVSHPDYRRFLSGVGGMYRINWRSYPPAVREIYIRFRELDLSAVDRIMQDQYQHDFSLERIVSLYSFAIISEIATSAASPLIAIRPLSSITQSK